MKSELAYEDISVQKRLLHSTLDNVSDAIVVFGTDHRVALINPVAALLVGHAVVGLPFAEWFRLSGFHDPNSGEKIREEEFPFRLPLSADADSARQLLLVKNECISKPLYVSISALPISTDGAGAVFTLHDETTAIQSEKLLKEERSRAESAMHQAEAANRAKSRFLANISHELRTPMTAILGYSETLSGIDQSSEQRRKSIRIIQRNGQLLLQLINDLLDLSKVESGRMVVHRQWVELDAIVSEVYHALIYRALEKKLEFNVTFDEPLPEQVLTDEVRLRQILVNVVGNAIKFTDFGGVTLRISLVDGALQFSVQDTGCGIDEVSRRSLFAPFFQVHSGKEQRMGSGLGLSLARRLCRSLGGNLTLKSSSPGRGSLFTVEVDPGPVGILVKGHQVIDFDDGAFEGVPVAPGGLVGVHILLMDDSDDNREVYEILLKASGATVVSAYDGQDGLEKFLQGMFDVLIVDIRMPRMDGLSVLREVQKRRTGVRQEQPGGVSAKVRVLNLKQCA